MRQQYEEAAKRHMDWLRKNQDTWPIFVFEIVTGARTGQYRTGLDDLLPGVGEAPAGISVADLAVAIVDELETPRHRQQRFTVAS